MCCHMRAPRVLPRASSGSTSGPEKEASLEELGTETTRTPSSKESSGLSPPSAWALGRRRWPPRCQACGDLRCHPGGL